MRIIPLAVAFSLVVPQAFAANAPALTTQKDQLSYSMGVEMGHQFKAQAVSINPDILYRGLKDSLSGSKTEMAPDQMKTVLLAFQKNLLEKQVAVQKTTASVNAKVGENFLSQNKKNPDVVTRKSGLQYKIIQAGKGAMPSKTDKVKVDYTGTLVNGTVFDKAKGAVLEIDQVIPGWTEALPLMKEGATWDLYIPANLAYGERGAGPIPPNSTLIFRVRLVGIEKAG